ncbi:hypothetical protein FRC06_002081, partial [Ceratobasidium sp. 370]
MVFTPVIKIGKDGLRQFDNVNSGDYWNLQQSVLQPGTMLGPMILMSNTTHLSQFTGDVSAHSVYMSLANIDKSVREDIGKGAWLLVGIIPKSNWDKTLAAMLKMTNDCHTAVISMLNHCLFHQCMEVITRPFRRTEPQEVLDWEGNTQLMQYELSIYGADLQEQCDIEGISRNACPHGKAKGKDLGA